MIRKLIYYRLVPLTSIWCHTVVLCGISRSFPLLSPCNRQIAHALLTSPPLSNWQNKTYCEAVYFVLPLIPHAASSSFWFNWTLLRTTNVNHTGAFKALLISKILSLASIFNTLGFFCLPNFPYVDLFNMLCSANYSVRLACLKHAASVRPEPGSNSN